MYSDAFPEKNVQNLFLIWPSLHPYPLNYADFGFQTPFIYADFGIPTPLIYADFGFFTPIFMRTLTSSRLSICGTRHPYLCEYADWPWPFIGCHGLKTKHWHERSPFQSVAVQAVNWFHYSFLSPLFFSFLFFVTTFSHRSARIKKLI